MSEPKNMMVYNSVWNGFKTFKMLPITEECPYNEVIFDPVQRMLAIISKEYSEKPVMLPRLNDKGDYIMKHGMGGAKPTAVQQRVMMDAPFEYYMDDTEDIKEFINLFASNATKALDILYSISVTKVAEPVEDNITANI